MGVLVNIAQSIERGLTDFNYSLGVGTVARIELLANNMDHQWERREDGHFQTYADGRYIRIERDQTGAVTISCYKFQTEYTFEGLNRVNDSDATRSVFEALEQRRRNNPIEFQVQSPEHKSKIDTTR